METTWTIAAGFRAFGVLHGLCLLASAGVAVAMIRGGGMARRRGKLPAFAATLAAAGFVNWVVQQGYYLLIAGDYTEAVPLHVCDLAALLGPVVMLWPVRLLRTTLYFWAFGLSIWGLLTPVLQQGPGHPTFWLFWINHAAIMGFASFDVVVRGYRPFLGDLGMAILMTLGYVAIVTPINLAMGWNYGYLGNVESEAWTPLDLLPPWPWRILAIEVLGALMLGLAWWPWALRRRWREPARPPG